MNLNNNWNKDKKNMIRNLFKELNDENFIPITYRIFNFIDEDYFIRDVEKLNNERYSIDDFSYYEFELTNKEKFLVKMHNKDFLGNVLRLKRNLKNQPNVKVYVLHDVGVIMVVKLKSVNINQNK